MARRARDRNRQTRLIGIALVVGGFGAFLYFALSGSKSTSNGGNPATAGPPPIILPPPAGLTNTGGGPNVPGAPGSTGAIAVRQGYVAVAIPYNAADVLQSRLAPCDHVQVVVGTASGTQSVDDVTILRVSTASTLPISPVGPQAASSAAAGAPSAPAAAPAATPTVSGGLVVEVPSDAAPILLTAVGHATSPIQFVFLSVANGVGGTC